MRLTHEEIATIKAMAIKHFGQDAIVLLFGSRVDDSKRGGDIDLLIQTSKDKPAEMVRSEIAFLADLKVELGDQKIDVVLDYPARKTHPPIFEIARKTGVLL